MSKKRLIPKLQLKSSHRDPNRMLLVTSKQFSDYTEIGDPVSQSKIYQDQGADELIFINIDQRQSGISKLSEIIRKVSEEIFMPITVGGGVRNEQDFKLLLSNGADKISINTVAIENPEIIKETSQKYGAQCVVVSIDYALNNEGDYRVFTNGGKTETSWNPLEWAIKCEELGAGEILLTSIDRDGMKQGIDIRITSQIAHQLKIPIITSGGCGIASHFSDAYLLGGADAVAAGTFFAHRDQNFMQTRSHICNAGVNIRLFR
jgi:cyclase